MKNPAKEKIISIRIDSKRYEQLKNNYSTERISSITGKIVSEYIDSLYKRNHSWVTIPKSCCALLFSGLDEHEISEFCKNLAQEIQKVNHVEYSEKSIWQTWLKIESDWSTSMSEDYFYKKTNDGDIYYNEHKTNYQISSCIYKMFLEMGKNFAEIHKVEMDDKKLVLKIKEL